MENVVFTEEHCFVLQTHTQTYYRQGCTVYIYTSKDALKMSNVKMTLKTIIILQKYYISNKCCSEISNQRILKKKYHGFH